MGIKQLPEYRDPYSKRVMTFGEIGCFLSHYRVWQDVSLTKCLLTFIMFQWFFYC